MPIELPAVLKLLNGNPLMKVKQVIGEFMPLTKSLDGGAGLGDMMSSLMNGDGLQSIIGNPMAAITGQLQGALGGLTGQLTSALGGDAAGLVSALTGGAGGGLSGALGSLSSAAGGLLSGTGIQDIIGHAGITDMVGAALPSNLSIDTVLGPANADGLVGQISAWVPGMVADVISGALPVADAIAQVNGHVDTITGIVSASSNALTTITAMATDIAAVSTAAAALVAAPVEIQAVLERAISPENLATMRTSVASHLDEPDADPEDPEPVA